MKSFRYAMVLATCLTATVGCTQEASHQTENVPSVQSIAPPITSLVSTAAAAEPATDDLGAVRSAVAKIAPGTQIDGIKPVPMKQLYEVQVGADVLYISADGQYAFQGDLMDVAKRENLTEHTRSVTRLKMLAAIDPNTMITFAPEHPQHTVTIFTDIDCGYCRKLHKEMAEYNRRGIAIRYLSFPRAGIGSDSYKKAVAVWCAKDRQAALTAAKADQPVAAPDPSCKNPVDEHFQLTRVLNLDGTPTMVLEDGSIIPGYVPADRLKAALDDMKKG